MGEGAILVGLVLWVAWWPAETSPATPALLAAGMLGLLPWAWQRTRGRGFGSACTCLVVGSALLAASASAGVAPEAGVRAVVLLAAVVVLAWLASREPPTASHVLPFALGLAALALWAVWQVAFGLERALEAVPNLPEALRAGVVERLEGGRAFASQLLPSHLAVLLATALPLLAVAQGSPRSRWAARGGMALCLVGILLSRSPVGAALALVALGSMALRGRRVALAVAGVAAAALVVLVGAVWLRTDVARLEPVALRVDNWRTAVWAWSSTPLVGVGLGGFGQVAQLVPFEVGNRPAHAHCLPLEALAELGPTGLAAVVLAAWSLLRLLVRLWPQHPGLAAALAVVPAHNLVDFSLLVSSVALPWAMLAGWGVALSREPAEREPPPRGRAAAVAVAAAALLVAALHGTSIMLERAAADSERPAVRYDRAWSAWRAAPWRVQPALLVAVSAIELGDRERCGEASRLLDRVRWWRPGSAAVASLESRLAVRRGDLPEAAARAWLASRRRPSDPRPAQELESLLDQLEATRHDPP